MDDGDGTVVLHRVSGGGVRAADTDRERVAQRLGRAHAEGRLDLTEFDERVRQVWGARTYDELDRVTADLPAESRAAAPASVQRRSAVAAWLTASLVNLAVWAVICLATGSWVYAWWVWVAGPWGAVLLAHFVTARFGAAPRPG